MALNAGDKAPDFDLLTDGGGHISSADLSGKSFVIYFYPKDDTSGCTKEAQAFSSLLGEFESIGVPVIGVSPDSVKSHDKFRTKYALTIRLAADESHATIEAFGAWAEKSMYGKKYMGVERSTFLVGKDGRIARAWPKVKVDGHAEEVLAAAKAL